MTAQLAAWLPNTWAAIMFAIVPAVLILTLVLTEMSLLWTRRTTGIVRLLNLATAIVASVYVLRLSVFLVTERLFFGIPFVWLELIPFLSVPLILIVLHELGFLGSSRTPERKRVRHAGYVGVFLILGAYAMCQSLLSPNENLERLFRPLWEPLLAQCGKFKMLDASNPANLIQTIVICSVLIFILSLVLTEMSLLWTRRAAGIVKRINRTAGIGLFLSWALLFGFFIVLVWPAIGRGVHVMWMLIPLFMIGLPLILITLHDLRLVDRARTPDQRMIRHAVYVGAFGALFGGLMCAFAWGGLVNLAELLRPYC